MIEIKRILAPTDFSAHSEQAVRYACGLAERLGAELHLVHVLSEIIPAGPDPLLMPVMPPAVLRGERGPAPGDSAEACSSPPGASRPRVVTAVRWGSPVEAIVDYAREQQIDLIVIATHGRTGPQPRPARLGRRADRPRGPLPRPHHPRSRSRGRRPPTEEPHRRASDSPSPPPRDASSIAA